MSKYRFFVSFLILLIIASCKDQQKPNNNVIDTIQKKTPPFFELEINDLTLINLPKDTNGLHIESALPSGNYFSFDFRLVPKNSLDSFEKIRGLYVELLRSENKNIPINYLEPSKPFNYHAYSFELSVKDWYYIKSQVNEIVSTVDTSLMHNYCASCPSYSLVYNLNSIEDKLTKTKKIEKLFNELLLKYKRWLSESITK